MKPFILFALLFPFYSNAQQIAARNNLLKKTTATPLRLVGVTKSLWYSSDYYYYDSCAYGYSGTRTSNFDIRGFNFYIDCDSLVTYGYNAATNTRPNFSNYLASYDAHNHVITSSSNYWNASSSTWELNSKIQHFFTYDTASRILTDAIQYWDIPTSSWINGSRLFNTYDSSSGHVVTCLHQNWNISTSSWEDHDRDSYTYDTSANMLTHLAEDLTGALVNNSKHTYAYTGSQLSSDQYQVWDTSSWRNIYVDLYSGYIADVPQEVTRRYWDIATSSYYNMEKHTYTYNAYGQPETGIFQRWNFTTGSWDNDELNRFYYNYPAAASNIVSGENKMNIYPIPAENTLNVSVEWAISQPFAIGIYDMAGKRHNSWDIPTCAKHTQAIPVSDLAPGNYIIRLQGIHCSESRQIIIK